MRSFEWRIGDFRITLREILVSIVIISLFTICGIKINEKITENNLDKAQIYNTAHKVEDAELFKHLMETDGGNAFVYGSLKAINPISVPEISGKYTSILMIHEEYVKKTRTYTDDEGNKHTETYYEWEETDRETIHCKQMSFCGVTFNYNKFKLPDGQYIDTVKHNYFLTNDTRTKYYGLKTEMKGTIFTNLSSDTISDNSKFTEAPLSETVEAYQPSSAGNIAFWIVWVFLMGGAVVGFCIIDNRWLG